MIEYSKLESQRFNKNIHRATLEKIDIKEIKRQILINEMDVLILRLPSASIATHCKLNNVGFDVLHADTLVFYETNLEKLNSGKIRNNVVFEKVDYGNIDVLEKIVRIIFENYSNHYYSNPLFNREDIRDGYVEWASSYKAEANSNRIAWIAHMESEVVGFLTCSYDKSTKESEGVLYGVLPGFSGRGVYSDFIRFSLNYFKEKGYSKMRVSTQIQNYAVQRVWTRQGFFLTASYETYHVNSCLSYSLEKSYRKKVTFSKEDVENFGALINAFAVKNFGTKYPGKGTSCLDEHSIFFSPIYPWVEYVIETSLLDKKDSGLSKTLIKVKKNHKIIMLSYNTLIP